MIYPDNLEYKIGFDIVRKTLASKCSNPLGKAECESMTFSNDYRLIVNSLSQTNEYLSIIKSTNDFPNGSIFDLRESLLKIKAAGSFLTETELYQLGKTLVSAAEICDYFTEEKSAAYPLLKQIADSLLCFPEISRHIDSILDKFGNIKDNASPELQQLRRKLLSVSSSVNGMMQRVISRYKQNGMLDKDCTPSIRDGRLVIPVAPMHKRAVKGIVHDESATGKTFFIEPEEIVEANNQIRELEADIHKEIVRILIMTADIIRPHLDDLTVFYQTIGVFDFIRAKALFANEIDATMPQISQKPEIEWYNAPSCTVHDTQQTWEKRSAIKHPVGQQKPHSANFGPQCRRKISLSENCRCCSIYVSMWYSSACLFQFALWDIRQYIYRHRRRAINRERAQHI